MNPGSTGADLLIKKRLMRKIGGKTTKRAFSVKVHVSFLCLSK